MFEKFRIKQIIRKAAPALLFAAGSVLMLLLPGAETLCDDSVPTERATVVEVDDSSLRVSGFVEFGAQHLKVKMPDGSISTAVNEMRGQAEIDKRFKVGDTAVVVPGEEPLVARDHWRIPAMTVFFGLFSIALCAFGGWTGAKALFSFVFSCLAVWKVLIPLCLGGWHASSVVFLTVALLTAVIMYLVAGWTKTAFAAFAGSMLGVIASFVLAHVCTLAMKVDGSTLPFARQLLYSGYDFIDLRDIFAGAAVLASSGAVMDLAMDIASGIGEVRRHNASLGFRELFASGLRIARAVVGTMTTTLLLAYSGGYLTLMMVFAAQNTNPVDFLNTSLVSSEIAKTLVGSLGLVLVAPFTAFIGALVFRRGEAG